MGTLVSGQSLAAEQDTKPAKDLVLTGDAVCTRCHEETAEDKSLWVAKGRHGTRADQRTPGCTSCHGESQMHVENPQGTDPRPLVEYFDKRNLEPTAVERNALCLDCHQDGNRIHWQGSAHDSQDVACDSCHTLHTQKDPVRDRVTQTDVCISCHTEKRIQINKISRHPTREGIVACSDCHNPHGAAGKALMARDTVTDTCYKCHAEKRGPFLWNHQPVNEDCSYCHNAHGSSIANMLKSRPPFLCQECHEPQSHRGGAPDPTSSFTIGRGCLNCHTNIHGGNNPTSSSGSRSFRQ